MDNKIDGCLECGSNDFTNIAGVVTCKNCGMQYPEMKLNQIENSKTVNFNSLKAVNFNSLKDLLTNKENMILFFKNLLKKKNFLIGLAIFIVLLILIVGFISSMNTNSQETENSFTENSFNSVSNSENVGVLNISDIILTISDSEDYSNYGNSTKNNKYYSSGELNFNVVTNGSIYNYSTNVKFYDGDKIISTYSKEATSSSSSNLTNGINHPSLGMYNEYSGSALPQGNGTITDIIITLEANINGVNTKLFETPKTNVGNLKFRYYTTPNPNYKQ